MGTRSGQRTVAIGIQDFAKIRDINCFYVDKTDFIREWWESNDAVTLIASPRRFGKTLNISMLEYFFSNKYAGQGELFEGLSHWMPRDIRYNEDLLMNYYLFDRAESAVFEGVCPYHYLLRKDSASCRGISEAYIFDPIRVRRLLLERCAPEMREPVQQALLRNLLFNYAQLDVSPQRKAYVSFRQRVRQMLLAERESFFLLSLRNKVLANMICYAPWSFHLAYGAYVAVFQREEQH